MQFFELSSKTRTNSKSLLLKGGALVILFGVLAFRPSMTAHAYTQANGLYAGYFVGIENARGTFKQVSVSFTVPTLRPTPQDSTAYLWAGLGGVQRFTPVVELVQAGIFVHWDATTHRQVNSAWWQVTGIGGSGKSLAVTQSMDTPLSIDPGNKIKVDVSSNLHGDLTDSFRVTNVTTGQSATHQETDPNALSDSTSAECVLENPQANPRVPLANFGTVTFRGCTATNDQGEALPISAFENQSQDNLYRTDILDDSGTPITTTGSLKNSTDFKVIWKSTGSPS